MIISNDEASQAILRMIETVDLADTAKLDEIDLAVEKYETGLDIWRDETSRRVTMFNGNPIHVAEPHQYTRSRSALKAIRPEGWFMNGYYALACGSNFEDSNYQFVLERVAKGTGHRICSLKCPTEELAELHAIIQAIAYERSLAA